VGIIMLVGLVKKNAIMMIDFALDAERSEGKTSREAILEACSIRFRPIMMTTMAALMGTLPIALGLGAGAESRRPLGLAVGGGSPARGRAVGLPRSPSPSRGRGFSTHPSTRPGPAPAALRGRRGRRPAAARHARLTRCPREAESFPRRDRSRSAATAQGVKRF